MSIKGTPADPIVLTGFNSIVGIFMPDRQIINPTSIPIINGLVKIDFTMDFRLSFLLEPLYLLADTVNITTEKALNIGTDARIIIGTIPEFPYMFRANGIPKIAALPLTEPWAKEPTIVLSLINIIDISQANKNIKNVTTKQNTINFTLSLNLNLIVAISTIKTRGIHT